MKKNIVFIAILTIGTLLIFACASQRTRATCAETEYRLNSMSYSPDQRAFLEEELRQCRAEQAEQEKDDVITNKIKGSIRERFAADSIAKANEDSLVTEVPVEKAEEDSHSEIATNSEIPEDVSNTVDESSQNNASEDSAGN